MTIQVRNLWCRSQNKMGPSSKYVCSQHIVDLRQPQVAMKHHLRSVKKHLCCAITIQRISTPDIPCSSSVVVFIRDLVNM